MVGLSLTAQKRTKIKLLGADEFRYSVEKTGKDKILIGHVTFKLGSQLLYCDSAILSSEKNAMKAYGHVKIVDQAKASTMTGDSLFFNGNKKQGKLRGKIKVDSKTQVLTTRHLDFNTATNSVHYFNGGYIIFKEDSATLTSGIGHFYSAQNLFQFKDSVVYTSADYIITSDTMHYESKQGLVTFLGPTNIVSDSSSIYCESGWFNQKSGISTFSQKVHLVSDEQILNCDSLIYNKTSSEGDAFGSVQIIDTLNNLEVRGEIANYNNTKGTSLVTERVHMIMGFTKDTLHLHSDTLTTKFDSAHTNRIINAFHHVQFFKPDLQGKCDSLSFAEKDSTIKLYKNPVVWIDSNQVTGKEIIITTYDGIIQNMRINEDAFIVSQEDTALYNQVKGKSLFAHFNNNVIYRIDVNRSGQTIYFVRDESKQLMGMNRLNCSNMSIFISEGGMDNIKFYNQPEGTFFPMKDVTLEMKLLRHFYWRINEKPQSIEDIFHWTEVPEYVINRRTSR